MEETLEEAAERIYPEDEQWTDRHIFNLGAKWQQENSYSEKQMDDAYDKGFKDAIERSYSKEELKQFGLYLGDNFKKLKGKTIDEIFKQFKTK